MARRVEDRVVPEREDDMRLKEEDESGTLLAATTMDDLPVRSFHPGRLLTFFANALPAGATFTLVSGPGNVDPNSGQFTWTPPPTQTGSVTVTIRASNAGGSTQKSTTLNRANQAPFIDFIPDRNGTVGSLLQFRVNAFDPENDSLQFSFVGAPPAGASVDGGLFSWTPMGGQNGTFVITVQAMDTCGATYQRQFNVIVP